MTDVIHRRPYSYRLKDGATQDATATARPVERNPHSGGGGPGRIGPTNSGDVARNGGFMHNGTLRLDHNGSAGANPNDRKRAAWPSSFHRVTINNQHDTTRGS